jgi:Ulp1 family protease
LNFKRQRLSSKNIASQNRKKRVMTKLKISSILSRGLKSPMERADSKNIDSVKQTDWKQVQEMKEIKQADEVDEVSPRQKKRNRYHQSKSIHLIKSFNKNKEANSSMKNYRDRMGCII